jgi:hypothetical protein
MTRIICPLMKIECYQKGVKINRTLLNGVNKVCEFHQISVQIQDCFPPPDLHFPAYYTGFPII